MPCCVRYADKAIMRAIVTSLRRGMISLCLKVVEFMVNRIRSEIFFNLIEKLARRMAKMMANNSFFQLLEIKYGNASSYKFFEKDKLR